MYFPIYPPYENRLQKVSFLSVQKCRGFMMPCLRQFTKILWCPAYVILHRFYNALIVSIYRDYTLPCLCQFTKILMDKTSTEKLYKSKFSNCQQFPLMSRDKIYKHFLNILEIKIEKWYKLNAKMVLHTFCVTYEKVATVWTLIKCL